MKFLIVLSLFSLNLLAAWSPSTLKEFDSLQGLVKYEESDFMTLWGAIHRYLNADDLKGEEYKVELEYFEEKLKIYSYDLKRPAPLVIFFPGIFGSHEGSISPSITNAFENGEFHVGVVPNFLNKNYIKAKPKYTKENAISLDVRASLEAAQKIIDRIGEDKIKKIVFVGESLGTYIASSSIQFKHVYPKMFNKLQQVILLWPPLDVKKSLEAFNQKFKVSKTTYDSCSMILKIPSFIKYYIWQDVPKDIPIDDAKCFGAYLFQESFMGGMLKSYEISSELKGSERESEPTNFSEFIEFHNPHYFHVMKTSPEKLQLSHWLNQWKATDTKIKIASSKDDFINNVQGWSNIENKYLFDWGEHCAPLSLGVWKKVLPSEAK